MASLSTRHQTPEVQGLYLYLDTIVSISMSLLDLQSILLDSNTY